MLITKIIGLFLFLVGFWLTFRAFRVAREEKPRFFRAAAGAMLAGAGNVVIVQNQMIGLLFLLGGVMLIFTSSTNQRRPL